MDVRCLRRERRVDVHEIDLSRASPRRPERGRCRARPRGPGAQPPPWPRRPRRLRSGRFAAPARPVIPASPPAPVRRRWPAGRRSGPAPRRGLAIRGEGRPARPGPRGLARGPPRQAPPAEQQPSRGEACWSGARWTSTYRTLLLDPGISGASLVCHPPVPTSRIPEAANRLTDILRALPQGELDGLIERLAIRIDPAKRIDVPSQVARALVSLPELRDAARLNPACVELMHRVAEARGSLLVSSVPPGLEPLLARGLMFARASGTSVELILPAAYLVQLKAWEGEDPRGMRALLSQAQFETMSAIASHYLGRPATPPLALSLESAWDVLGNARQAGRGDRQALADRAARPRGGRGRRRRGRHRGAARARARASADADGHRRGALAQGRRLLARAARPSHPRPPEPSRRPHRGERHHRSGAPHRARGAAGRGEDLRRLGRPRAPARALLARSVVRSR